MGLRLPESPTAGRRSNVLALVPVLSAAIVWAIAMPRPVVPSDVPLPTIDGVKLEARAEHDRDLAASAQANRLPVAVRALGSAIRAFDAAEVRDDEPVVLSHLRASLEESVGPAEQAAGIAGLERLRAVETEEFVAEVRRFERDGTRSRALDELGGTFLRSLARVGWVRDAHGAPVTWPPAPGPKRVLLDEDARRAAFKLTWNRLVGLEQRSELELTLDEQRVLYSFYLRHPHAPESQRTALAAARSQAKNPDACERIDDGERVAAMGWLLTKLKELAALDPTYPAGYAMGIVLYHRHDYAAAADALRAWLDAHPSGPLTLRTRNYLRAADEAGRAM